MGFVMALPDITVGLGWSSAATEADVRAAIADTLRAARIDERRVGCVAISGHKDEQSVIDGLGWPIRAFTTEQLAEVLVPTPSERVGNAVGAPSVAEAAALLAAGEGASLMVAKQRFGTVTVAVALARSIDSSVLGDTALSASG